ncbi:hypothetical protein KDW_48880 [Dictyobacter vulcani]|uniref:Uncharacterized protein n=1 Tax=Dictyobacter vulcani TaxID=2607529 RepID=A0A5J4KZR4_9CHLR|nr:hypothetical protein [Dictyobacter vulcani]GER90726.1 hypothetical protein KDW_48880 [Dictyobacter vulcani]
MGRVRSVEYLIVASISLFVCIISLLLWSPMAFATTLDTNGPFTITASSFKAFNFHLDLRVVQNGGSLADAIVLDAIATKLVFSKQVSLPFVGTVTFQFANTGNNPVRFSNLRAHVISITSDQGNFTSLNVIGIPLESIISGKLPTTPINVPDQPGTPTIRAGRSVPATPGSSQSDFSTATNSYHIQATPVTDTEADPEETQHPLVGTVMSTPDPLPVASPVPPTINPPGLPDLSKLTITLTNVTIKLTSLDALGIDIPDMLLSVQ